MNRSTFSVRPRQEFNPDLFDFNVTAPSLRGHIVNEHLKPDCLAMCGIPKDDIDFALYLGFDLGWVRQQVELKLGLDDSALAREIFECGAYRFMDVTAYRGYLTATLSYLQQLVGDMPGRSERI